MAGLPSGFASPRDADKLSVLYVSDYTGDE
jgi:hypothetical protein